MNKVDSSKKNKFPKAILLNHRHLENCLELDLIALNGLWSRGQWEKELNSQEKLCLGIIKSQKLLAIACGSIIFDEIHITAIAVHPNHRRQGAAKSLLMALLEKARENKVRFATLEVSSINHAARALYKSVGFITKGNRPCYYKNGSDALIQWYSLNEEKTLS